MTVYKNERTFSCDVIANVLGVGPRRYLWTKFINASGSVGERLWQTSATTTFESAFPPFVYMDENDNPHLCCFVRDEDSLRTYTTFDNYSEDPQSPSTMLPHAYVHRCVASYSDAFTGTDRYAGCPGRSSEVDGVDVFENYVDYASIISVNDHLGAVGNMAGSSQLYNSTHTTFFTPNFGAVKGVRIITGVRQATRGTYFYASDVADGDYRIIYGMNFNSGQEWLDYCRTH